MIVPFQVDGDDASRVPFAAVLRLLAGPPGSEVALVFQRPPPSARDGLAGILSQFAPRPQRSVVGAVRIVPPRPPREVQALRPPPPPALQKRAAGGGEEEEEEGGGEGVDSDGFEDQSAGDAEEESAWREEHKGQAGEEARDVAVGGSGVYISVPPSYSQAAGLDKGRPFSIQAPPSPPALGGGWASQPPAKDEREEVRSEDKDQARGGGGDRASVPVSSMRGDSVADKNMSYPVIPPRTTIYDAPAPSSGWAVKSPGGTQLEGRPHGFRDAVERELKHRKEVSKGEFSVPHFFEPCFQGVVSSAWSARGLTFVSGQLTRRCCI